jgi:hypothetical protein
VTDGPLRRAVKRLALWSFDLNIVVYRGLSRLRGQQRFKLGGECRRCARCCEAPGIQVGRLVWFVPSARRLFLWWQRQVNGFELVSRDARARMFVFRCSHFDWQARACDSYDSRPGMCRDSPRNLMAQTNPELLSGCGYRAVDVRGDAMLRALEQARVTPLQMAKLKKTLHLEK